MSALKAFSQCSLSDLALAILEDSNTSSARALDPATADRLLPALRNAALTEAVLQRHPLVRDRSGLKCDGSAHSRRAWCGMLRDLAGAAGVEASDAALLRVYLVCKECAKQGGVHVSAAPPPPAPSFNFEYDDRFLGRLMRIPAAQLRQVDAPLQLMHALSFHFSRTLAPRAELRQPPPPLLHTQVALWPAQRARHARRDDDDVPSFFNRARQPQHVLPDGVWLEGALLLARDVGPLRQVAGACFRAKCRSVCFYY